MILIIIAVVVLSVVIGGAYVAWREEKDR